jgi:hypothetical protein
VEIIKEDKEKGKCYIRTHSTSVQIRKQVWESQEIQDGWKKPTFLPLLQTLRYGEITGVGAGRGQLWATLVAGHHLRALRHNLLWIRIIL